MANDGNDNVPEHDPQRHKKKSEAVRLGILVGVAVLIVIAGMNLYETRQQRIDLNDRMTQLATAINSRPATGPAPVRPSGPDPEKIYTVRTEGAPFRGSKSAPVTIVEISDFQ